MSPYRIARAIGLCLLSVGLVIVFVRHLSLDFDPIVGYFDEIAKLRGFDRVVSYSFFGNMMVGVPLEYIIPGDSTQKTFALYVFAAIVRCLIFVYFIPPRYALLGLFSSFVTIELNQARLSLALSALFLFFQLGRTSFLGLAAFGHLSVLPILPLYYLKPKKLLLPFFVLVVGLVILSAEVFPRYFAGGRSSGVPLNTFLYFGGAAYLYYWLWRQGQYTHDFLFYLFYAGLIFSLTFYGFSPVYVGRIAELCWHIVVFRFLTHFTLLLDSGGDAFISKNKAQIVVFGGCCIMFALGIYKVLLLDGNIWSYF